MTCKDLIKILKSKFRPTDKFNFLDFGAENVDFFLTFKKEFPRAKYFLTNQKTITKHLKNIKIKYNLKELNILTNSNQIFKNKYEFINFGSSIQYINDYKKLILKIIKVSKKYIFFSGITFFQKKREFNKEFIIVKQVNLIPDILYCLFFDKEKFEKIFTDRYFKTILKRKNFTKVNYSNFINYRKINYEDIFFKYLK